VQTKGDGGVIALRAKMGSVRASSPTRISWILLWQHCTGGPEQYSFQYEIDMEPQAQYFSIDFYGCDILIFGGQKVPYLRTVT
jgi:hypothetical protein